MNYMPFLWKVRAESPILIKFYTVCESCNPKSAIIGFLFLLVHVIISLF